MMDKMCTMYYSKCLAVEKIMTVAVEIEKHIDSKIWTHENKTEFKVLTDALNLFYMQIGSVFHGLSESVKGVKE